MQKVAEGYGDGSVDEEKSEIEKWCSTTDSEETWKDDDEKTWIWTGEWSLIFVARVKKRGKRKTAQTLLQEKALVFHRELRGVKTDYEASTGRIVCWKSVMEWVSSTSVEKYYDRIEIIQEIWRNFSFLKGTKVYCFNNRDESFLNSKTLPKIIPAPR